MAPSRGSLPLGPLVGAGSPLLEPVSSLPLSSVHWGAEEQPHGWLTQPLTPVLPAGIRVVLGCPPPKQMALGQEEIHGGDSSRRSDNQNVYHRLSVLSCKVGADSIHNGITGRGKYVSTQKALEAAPHT